MCMRTIEQTTQEILELATMQFKVPAGSLAADDDFYKKLGIDSLQALEMLSRLENHFRIELPDYEVQGVSDFKTLAHRSLPDRIRPRRGKAAPHLSQFQGPCPAAGEIAAGSRLGSRRPRRHHH